MVMEMKDHQCYKNGKFKIWKKRKKKCLDLTIHFTHSMKYIFWEEKGWKFPQ